MAGLLFAHEVRINDAIAVRIPTIGEIAENEDAYYGVVSTIIATPYDMMVQLDDIGLDWTKLTEFDLFILMFKSLQASDTHLVLGDLDLTKFQLAMNNGTKEFELVDPETEIIIDRAIHAEIGNVLRHMLNIEKPVKKPANEEARKYMISRARAKMKRDARRKKKNSQSQLEQIVTALVNISDFPYDYESVKGITIYQLYASLAQISHKINFDNLMAGYYAGTIKGEDLTQEDKSWIRI